MTKNEAQWSGKNLQGRSVILDVKCTCGDEREIDVEVQTANNDDHQRRVRYNGSILTTNVANPGTDFKQVPNVVVVYIAQFDVFESSKDLKDKFAVYHVDRVLRETGEMVDNGFDEIYVNACAKDGTAVSELMEVFTEDSAYNDKFPKTSEIKGRFKKDEKEKSSMCTALNDYVQELRKADAAKLQQYAEKEKQYAVERQQYAAERQQYANKISELEAKLAKLQG